ncbi:FxsA family protein [Mycolicibacterium thermoresistibile]
MALRLFLLYVVVELAVLITLVATIGFGWTLLAVLATFVLGLALAGSQVRRHIRRLRSTLTGAAQHTRPGADARAYLGNAADSVMVAAGTVLVVVPGLASSVLGALLLAPPTRAVLRPVVTAVATRSIARHAPLITVAGYRAGRADYIDGEVIDGEVVDTVDAEQPRLPRHPD